MFYIKNYYGSNYLQAFDLIGVKYNNDIYSSLIKPLEYEGYNEQGICFAIRKAQDKLIKFVHDNRFKSIFINEVRKHSYKVNDPRWKTRK